jgi:hypothetical protein
LLIVENKLVVPLISAIIDHPVIARMVIVSLHSSIHDAKLRGGGEALDKDRSLVGGAFAVEINVVNKRGDPCKVDDLIVTFKGDSGGSLGVMWERALMAGTRLSVQAFIASDSKGCACL